ATSGVIMSLLDCAFAAAGRCGGATGSAHVANTREPATHECRVGLDDDAELHVDSRLHEPVTEVHSYVTRVRNSSVTSRHQHEVTGRNAGVGVDGSSFVDLISRVVQQRHAGLSPGHHGETRAV